MKDFLVALVLLPVGCLLLIMGAIVVHLFSSLCWWIVVGVGLFVWKLLAISWPLIAGFFILRWFLSWVNS